ncbi:hypothetical protein BDR04DRAFT_1164609 [Suillus decipiens]|nr:hypothetical protein BDR04DRAFT_1164609 [Suillus decipiens]
MDFHLYAENNSLLALLLADKGYPSSPYILRPFTEPEVNGQPPVEKQCHHKFNKHLSSQCITIEHAFGMVKGHFFKLERPAT